MNKIRTIYKAENVDLWRHGQRVKGTLNLTPHHLIFLFTTSTSPSSSPDQNCSLDAPLHPPPCASSSNLVDYSKPKPRDIWIAYPMINHCTLRLSQSFTSAGASSIRVRCRDFVFVAFCFDDEVDGRKTFETLKALTCNLESIENLYAFSYEPPPLEREYNGWDVFDMRREMNRMGISNGSNQTAWRISTINQNYEHSPTYPALLTVPKSISDSTLNYAFRYRSRGRIPILTYLHPVNSCSISRSSQPLVGVRGNRSVQDEKLVFAIFSTSKPAKTDNTSTNVSRLMDDQGECSPHSSPKVDEVTWDSSSSSGKEIVYGAQQNNLIVDARPSVNAYAMQAMGMGSENMDHYKIANKIYLGIDSIHVMRDSYKKVVEAMKDTDFTINSPNRELLFKSGWLRHISTILNGADIVTRQIGIHHSHVLIHCSDGWDRTTQLSALSQLCLDPYYRTMKGFMVLVEKDWLSFGHMFRRRSGFLNSEKWFEVENDKLASPKSVPMSVSGIGITGGSSGRVTAIDSALNKALSFFMRSNDASETNAEEESKLGKNCCRQNITSGSTRSLPTRNHATVVKDTSPIFHQFLDATYQILVQHPTRFEFNERFLRRLLYHLYSCQYGTFLFDSEKEREEEKARERTRSVWDYFLSRKQQFLNENFDEVIDDTDRNRERIIFPRPNEVRWWAEVFGCTDAEMNLDSKGKITLTSLNGSGNNGTDNRDDKREVTMNVMTSTMQDVWGSRSTLSENQPID